MALLKYATFVGDVVDTITFYPDRDAEGNVLAGQELVPEDVFAGFIRSENGSFSPPPLGEPLPPPVPDEISDRQFFQQMAVEGRITEQEALDAVGSGVIPAAMDALVEQLPENQRFAARMLIRGATTFRRDHPVTELIGQLYGMTADQIDDLWRNASKL